MMSRFTGATDSSHKIEIESKEDMPQDKEPAIQWPSECCIYKVPKKLRKVNPEAYTPKLISIGPIHHGNPELEDMQMLKQKYCDKFFGRTTKAKEFVSFIKENETNICKCYAEEITPRGNEFGNEFVDMILLDSIFIIELFMRSYIKEHENEDENEDENDYILSKPWLKEGIKHDLILLENQLPLCILKGLYGRGGDKECFITLPCNFFTLACNFFDLDHEDLYKMEGIKHFTDLHRTSFRPLRSEIRGAFQNSVPLPYSATVLQNTAGLIFQNYEGKQREDRGLLDIQLNRSCLTQCFKSFLSFKCLQTRLVVPQFEVHDGTEELFRNLMALEQCDYPDKAYICNYIVLLDYLINSKEDVELLVDKRIIVNLLGSNKAVAEMVNKLCLEIVETDSYYHHIIDDLNNYCESCWNRNIASLINVYFRDIWRSTATVVGVLVLLITIFNFLKPFVFKNI